MLRRNAAISPNNSTVGWPQATFLREDADLATRYGHLTARQAARVAAECGVRRLVPTHFSPR
ncbi:ribonuclease Z [Mycobacterium bohemicum DSM 44277]|uniref:Uncharacterized protein n=2 Tax=Mycobacterium bohemicum TaxID=56425 RepID=A0A1X1QW64_MYCBE|nr:hypothetical protein AWB93_24445 [Mycobacterium bohemicum]CPR10876.1 ribonuclease Z [Mycobacterium bohemicum DSM 44277]